MTAFYYYLVMLNALVAFAAAAVVFWRNRSVEVGPALGMALAIHALWLVGYAHYLVPMAEHRALFWGQWTLSFAILGHPFLLHGMCALADGGRRYRWWLVIAYASGLTLLVLLFQGLIISGMKPSPYMHHYIQYNRSWYGLLVAHVSIWQCVGGFVLCRGIAQSVGYKRTQLVYFLAAWFLEFITINTIIVPLEYDINLPPVGLFVLPLNMTFLAYVMAKARLADYNVVIARLLLHALTLLVITVATLVSIAVMMVVAPRFMNPQQILFMLVQVVVIGLALAVGLPRWLPRAERIMQERLFGSRYGYQDALAGLVRELSRIPTIDEVLERVATTVHSQMQVTRVLIFMQDPLAGTYKVEAQSGLTAEELAELTELPETSPVVNHLQHNHGVLVRDELPRRVSPDKVAELTGDLNWLKTAVCAPMILDEKLAGMLCVGEKATRDMFFVSDLRLLETLATEVALAVKYRRMEDQVFRKNKLIELGTMAAGIAHEVRNPLASIRTFAQLMPDRMDDPEFKNEFSQLVLKDVDRITKVIETMLAFARPSQITIQEQPANQIADEAALLVQSRLKSKHVELTKHFHGDPIVKVDKQQILQVLINLLNNAVDALPEHGKIRVSTGVRPFDMAGNGDQKFAVIEVADNGPGIPPPIRNRLFDPFFTTKKEGTGLGLSISQKIVRDHGGLITVSSVEGRGTTFQVNLPVS